MKIIANKTVVAITGAGSGIGQQLALVLANKGCHLSLSDVSEAGLKNTQTLCQSIMQKFNTQLLTQILDVSQRESVYLWAEQTQKHFGAVHAVINNAGVAMGCPVEDLSYEDFEWIMNINFWGMVYGTKAFLPLIKASGGGHITNISSVYGIAAQPSQSGYNSSKFAIRGFTESLSQELTMENCGVGVTSVHPGGIRTNIANAAKVSPKICRLGIDPNKATEEFNKILFKTPESAAKLIIRAMERNKQRLVIGVDGKAIDWMQRLMPSLYQRINIWVVRRMYR
jgi:short-subunit dehydrogenase